MIDRTPSEKIWNDLESQLAAMDHTQLVRICAHLIRTYVVEDHRNPAAATPVQPASPTPAIPEERPAAATERTSSSPFGASADRPRPAAEESPRPIPKKQEPGYDKLEMD